MSEVTSTTGPSIRELDLRDGDIALPSLFYSPQSPEQRVSMVVSPAGLGRGDLDAYRWAGERFASLGYSTLVHTYRAASPYSDAADAKLAVDELARGNDPASTSIVLFGHSRGGIAALNLAASDPRVAAVVSVAAVIDLGEYVSRVSGFAPSVSDALVQFMGGSPEEIGDSYESLRVLSFAKSITQPVLLIHGTADMRVPLDHSSRLKDALVAAGNDSVELEIMPGVGHYLELATRGYQFDEIVARVAAWLTRV
jgi:dipeptidyl aminopeptidase/acylaminoacyl peptidase